MFEDTNDPLASPEAGGRSSNQEAESPVLRINHAAVVVATVVAFVVGGLWYSPLLFGQAYATLRGVPAATAEMAMPSGEIVAELTRVLVVAYVLARLLVRLGAVHWLRAVRLGLLVWLGFQAVLVGSVVHEGYPRELFAIHAGDALVKTVLMSAILGAWRKTRPARKVALL